METSTPQRTREIGFRHSRQFLPILQHLNVSLLVSTYAAGKLVCVGRTSAGSGGDQPELTLEFANFRRAMGIARNRMQLAIGGPQGIWTLRNAAEMTASIEPQGQLDMAYLAADYRVTGNIHVHEMGFDADNQLWLCNTLFSCLCTLNDTHHFVPRWCPPFISALAPEDRCHLNGIAWEAGRIVAVTAMGQTDTHRGWRDGKTSGGVVMRVPDGEILAEGFCMPHSPRVHPDHPDRLFVLDSGRGTLVGVDLNRGQRETIASYPGYGRGLALTTQFAFIGMSRARETSVFGGVPICEDRQAMRCGIVVVDLNTGKQVAFLEFESGVDELFDVAIVPECRRIGVLGPSAKEDGRKPVWVIPPFPNLGGDRVH
ncbi:MAG: TIGR03032 family protein [Planctomycetota bacterium]